MNEWKLALRALAFAAVMVPLTFGGHGRRPVERRLVELHFEASLDGAAILQDLDDFLAGQQETEGSWRASFASIFDRWGREEPTPLPEAAEPLAANTLLVFGATADGVGIGTGFTAGVPDAGSAVILTAFHVVERFCRIPADLVRDRARDGVSYPCEALYALHDIGIDTGTSRVVADGPQPWKSPVRSLDFFDKKLDLALFRIGLPPAHGLSPTELVTATEPKAPRLEPRGAQLRADAKGEPEGGALPLEAFELRMVAYGAAYKKDGARDRDEADSRLIRRRWYAGRFLGTRAFENERKLGFLSAFKHSLEGLPGSSGAALALTDGRIVGMHASLLMNRFYASEGCAAKLVQVDENYAIPMSYLKEVLSP
ncbi:MAG: trypsin-like peptidase domain-containing protein [Oligoflexia bacterium]|nr:trypsin-like peptidase domain-containing protein [Oligoflexia bacterium]